jgi:hypothetical protein
MLTGLNDSKQVRPELRAELAERIKAQCAGWAIGEGERRRDRPAEHLLGVGAGDGARHRRGRLRDRLPAHRRRADQIVRRPARAGDQGRREVRERGRRLDRGQGPSRRLLVELDERHPQYGFAEHKGYATQRHIAALRDLQFVAPEAFARFDVLAIDGGTLRLHRDAFR